MREGAFSIQSTTRRDPSLGGGGLLKQPVEVRWTPPGADLSPVVSGHLHPERGQLAYLHLTLVFPLKATEQHTFLWSSLNSAEQIQNKG